MARIDAATAPSVSPDDRVISTGRPKAKAAKGRSGKSQKPPASGARRKSAGAPKSTNRRKSRGFLGGILYWGAVASIWTGIAAGGVVLYFGLQLPSASSWTIPDRPPNVMILAADGSLIANRGSTGGSAMRLAQMSPYVPMAVVAIEDRRFYHHPGVDPIGLARAMATNLAAGRLVQGGSTLTQQLAKNLFLSPERTIGRKVQEVVLALWLESKYTKDEILEMYLNRVYFGAGAYGIDAAAHRYFEKPAGVLDAEEAALLAGLLKAPSRLSPASNPQGAQERAQVVLGAMRDMGMIGTEADGAALAGVVQRAGRPWDGALHYAADSVMDRLPDLIARVDRDIIVETTLDPKLQRAAAQALARTIAEHGADKRVSQGAIITIGRDGNIVAMVGGLDYGDSQFNRATKARRQPGSAFKPFVYAAALERGMTPDTVRTDAPVRFGKWAPENYKNRYHGPVTLEQALAGSYNSVAAQLIMETGVKPVTQLARRTGIETALGNNASLALGTSEMTLDELTGAYLTFARGGERPFVHLIKRIRSEDGRVLYDALPEAVRVMHPDVAGMMNRMLASVVNNGTGKAARIDRAAAGKTGTTQNSRDALFIGYTADFATGVWFGNDDGTAMRGVTGGSLPAETWKVVMEAAHSGRSPKPLPTRTPLGSVPSQRPSEPMAGLPAPGRDATATASTRRPGEQGDTARERTVLDILLGR